MNNDIMVTNAMLAAYLETENKDYLGLVKPFVLFLLPSVGDKVDISKITRKLRDEFGFSSIIDNVVIKILLRICKEDKYLEKRGNKNFYVVTEYNKKQFTTKQTEIKNQLQSVITELRGFLEKSKYGKSIDDEVAQNALILFLSNYNYICSDIDRIIGLSGKKDKEDDSFWVARFIISARNENLDVFSAFFEVVKGSLASRAIELYSKEETAEENTKLTGTTFFFDTRLLISALGLAREEENNATNELVSLIYENGGLVATFDCYVKELHGILTKYIRDINARADLSLDYFNKIRANTFVVQQYADSLADELEKAKIDIWLDIDKTQALENKDWPIGINELKKCLREHVKYDLEDQRGIDALNTDSTAIENISLIRYGVEGRQNLENCKAVLVTQNKKLTFAVFQYFKKLKEHKGISLTVNEVDLSALLWLKYCKNESSLPEWRLLENAYAACYPTKQVLDEFGNCIKALEALGIIDEKKLFLVKSNKISLETLADRTENNPEKVTKETVKVLLEEAEDIYVKELKEQFAERDSSIKQQEELIAVEEKRSKEELERKQKELETKNRYLEKEKENIKQEKKQIKSRDNKIVENAQKKAHDKAQEKRTRVEKKLKIVFFVILIIAMVLLGYGAYVSFSCSANWFCKIALIFFILISLVGAVELIFNKFSILIKPLIVKMGANAYKKKYNEAFNEYTSIIPE